LSRKNNQAKLAVWRGVSADALAPACLLVLLISLTIAPNAQAQFTGQPTITNLQYPQQVALQNGAAQATVTFTLSFPEPPPGYLIFGIRDVNSTAHMNSTNYWATGSAASTPDPCQSENVFLGVLGQSLVASDWLANSAVCTTLLASSSVYEATGGVNESASFSLTFNATRQYNLTILVMVLGARLNIYFATPTRSGEFTISVTTQTSPSTTTALTSTTTASTPASTSTSASTPESAAMIMVGLSVIVIAIGLTVFVVRRRKGKRTGGTAAEEPASRPSPAPVPTAEGTKFCTACGVRIPVTAPFCVSCGGKQD